MAATNFVFLLCWNGYTETGDLIYIMLVAKTTSLTDETVETKESSSLQQLGWGSMQCYVI
jgi:hypothetical protein